MKIIKEKWQWFYRIAAIMLFIIVIYPVIVHMTGSDQQRVVDRMQNLLDVQSLPNHVSPDELSRSGPEAGKLDVNEYFRILRHLKMAPETALDYVYAYNGFSGYPILYARSEHQQPIKTFKRFADLHGGFKEAFNAQYDYLDKVSTDGTAEGFFELVVLRLLGDQFYLDWHAYYNYITILCDRFALERLLFSRRINECFLPIGVQLRARLIDCMPKVHFEDDRVRVSVVIYSDWGGFFRYEFQMMRNPPYHLLETHRQQLVKYNCGVWF
ncbi:MAG: hypothetical protein AB1611_01390 [bacterium]